MKVKKVESTIKPNDYEIRSQSDNLVEVVFFDDITEETRTSDDGTEQTIYTYYENPINIVYREDLESYIEDNIETWKKLAKQQYEDTIAAKVREIRNQLLTESDSYMIFDRAGLKLPDTISATTMLTAFKDLISSLKNLTSGEMAKYRQALRDITKQTLGQIAGAIGIITVISGFFIAVFKWYKSKIEDRIDNLELRVKELEIASETNKEENALLLKGQLACLKGLKEQGCNGPVTQSINEIEAYLVKQAHR